MSTCNRLDLETLGSWPVMLNSTWTLVWASFIKLLQSCYRSIEARWWHCPSEGTVMATRIKQSGDDCYELGASMVKWTKIVHWYIKTMYIWVKGLKVVAICKGLNWIFIIRFQDDLYCCVKYSNVELQVEIFKTYHLKWCSKAHAWIWFWK